MPLVTSEELLLDAQKKNYAVGAFNIENMEMAQAVVEAAEECRSPVILQTTPSTLRYGSPELYCSIASALAAKVSVPVVMHLDHGSSFSLAARAFRAGYTSVMIDGSQLPLEENIALTRQVTEMCSPAGIPVEGELGLVGGKEDDTQSDACAYTDPEEALRFERETGLSSMAVGVGTAHGVYAATPVLNTELISRLKGLLSSPMVLHGASGLTDEAIRDCVSRGICKVNFATELRIAYTEGVRSLLTDGVFDPKVYGKSAKAAVKALVKNRMAVCGCAGRY